MKSIGSSPTNRVSKQPYSDGDAKPCPDCGGTMRFNRHYPVLTGHLASSSEEPSKIDRLHYVAAWVCENSACSFSLVISPT
jgi:hypothetical protein